MTLEETKALANELAEIAVKEHGIDPETGAVVAYVAEEAGYAESTIRHFLKDEYKSKEHAKSGRASVASKATTKTTSEEEPEDTFDAQKAVEEEAHLQELRKMGTEIGESMVEAYMRMAKDVKAAKPNYELISNVAGLDMIIKRMKQIPCPYHPNQTSNQLRYECGHTLEEAKKRYKAMQAG